MWIDKIRLLAKTYTWASFAGTTLDEIIYTFLQGRIVAAAPKKYDEHNFDYLLGDVSTLLNRCLTYRKEYAELMAQAASQAADYDLFEKQSPYLEELENQGWHDLVRSEEAKGHDLAAAKFATDAAALPAGFNEESRAGAASARAAIAGEALRRGLVREKWNLLRQHQRDLADRHSQPGHALNYADRAERVLSFLLDDLGEAWDKTAVAIAGMARLLNVQVTPPLLNQDKPLDNFVSRVREIVRQYELCTQGEIDIDRVISLANAQITSVDGPMQRVSLILNFDADLQTKNVLEFSLGNTYRHPPIGPIRKFQYGLADGRLRAIGLSLVLKDKPEKLDVGLLRASAIITIEGKSVYPNQTEGPVRRPFALENISVMRGNRPEMYMGAAIRNVSPRVKWKIDFKNFYSGNRADAVQWVNVADVLLHLTLTG